MECIKARMMELYILPWRECYQVRYWVVAISNVNTFLVEIHSTNASKSDVDTESGKSAVLIWTAHLGCSSGLCPELHDFILPLLRNPGQ